MSYPIHEWFYKHNEHSHLDPDLRRAGHFLSPQPHIYSHRRTGSNEKPRRNIVETPLRLFTLVTTSLPYKYLSFISVGLGKAEMYAFKGMQKLELLIIDILSIWCPEILTPAIPLNQDAYAMPVFVSDFRGYRKALESMQAHESQLVWFRYLNVAFSKYLWVNTYMELQA